MNKNHHLFKLLLSTTKINDFFNERPTVIDKELDQQDDKD